MPTLNELRETFFSDRPVTQIFFGEPAEKPIMDTVLRKSKILPIDAAVFDDAVMQQAVAGTYPLLVQSYDDFRFDTIVPEDQLRDYLRAHMDRPDPRISLSFTKKEAQVGIVQNILKATGRRPFKVVPVDDNIKFYFLANARDRLIIATLGRTPVPGHPVNA